MKLAIVTPWFGRDLKGGAEQQAWQVASRLAARGHEVEILTTCCRSHQDDWAINHFPEGETPEPEGFVIRRFLVQTRDRQSFDRVCSELLQIRKVFLRPGVPPISADKSRIFFGELIKSEGLIKFIANNRDHFDHFLLLPYLYGPILEAVTLLGNRAALQPCLHDEAYAYLPEIAEAFYRAGLLLFNSDGELELALKLFGPGILPKAIIVGEGVEASPELHVSPSGNSPHSSNGHRYILYLGRKDKGKNVDLLVRSFQRFRAVRPNSNLELILAGYGTLEFRPSPGLSDLGLVSEEVKNRLLRECLALAQPSENESFSRAMMEAWLHSKPVAAHAQCLATATAVRQCDGGWLASDETEWAGLFVEFDRTAPARFKQLGENGRSYARQAADWERVMERYEQAFRTNLSSSHHVVPQSQREINQFLPNLSYGDAISNEALLIRDHLRASGIESEIFARFIDPRVEHECHLFSSNAVSSSSALIYHHSIGTEITPFIVSYRGPKCLIYHNITPSEFVAPYRPDFAQILQRGREELSDLASSFALSVGDSSFNADELAACGFRRPGVLPICVDPANWAFPPDPDLMRVLQDGRTNLLFVGRLAPNKKQDDLLRAFDHYLELDPEARLILAGAVESPDPYLDNLRRLIQELDLESSVIHPGNISQAQLAAYYRTAHLFWSMSEHEGFCVPLIEAMWFDVPVLAFRSSAIPETLGQAAMMFTDKKNLREIAALAYLLANNSELRWKIVKAQRLQRQRFVPEEIAPLLDRLADQLQPL